MNDKYKFIIIKNIIIYYSNSYTISNGKDVDILVHYKNLLLKIIELIKDSINLSDLNELLWSISESGDNNDTKYIESDAALYLTFQIVSDEILRHTDKQILVDIIEQIIYGNSSRNFMDILMEYLDDDLKQKVYDYISLNVTPLQKPNYYESLFTESV
jgi:hypothetical protein